MNRMLKVDKRLLSNEMSPNAGGPPELGPRNFYMRIIRHQLPIMLVFFILCMSLGVIYLFVTKPTYVATASMMIDTRKAQLLDPQAKGGEPTVDVGMVQTQIELLKSQNVSRAVVKELHLMDDPEFAGGRPGFIGSLTAKFWGLFSTPGPPPTELQRMLSVLAVFQGKRTVTRVGQSYVMEISVQSTNAEKAARIANAIANAYIDDQLEAKYEATRRASVWLQDRLKELSAQVAAQQQAVVNFREKNNIIDTGGRLMNDQQLSEVNSQLILAQAATAEAKARYDRIQEVLKQEVPDASIADALNNQIIIKLRGEYLEMASRVSIWTQKYGAEHLSVLAQRTQMREVLRSIRDEMGKIEQSYKSEYQIALAREQSLRNSLGKAVSQSQITNQAQVQLRELESNAQTSRSLHDNFLQRYMEAVQQQSFPITEARLIGPAETPLSKSFPKTSLILLITAAAGLAVSFGIAAVREMMDRVFRSSDQVEEELQLNCLAMLPRLKAPAVSDAEDIEGPPPPPLLGPGPLRIRSHPLLDQVLDEPFSQFSEALRTVKVASDISGILKSKRVMGVISTVPGEGKTTICANYAQLIAHGGSRAILIDADLRNPSLSRQLAYDGPGLIDVLAGWKTVDEVLLVNPRSGLRMLPSGQTSNLPHTNELLASDAMKKLIMTLQDTYDYIIADLPPLIPVVDARASTSFVDSYLYVVEWGTTKIDLVKHGLSGAPELYERLLGVILNKVDMTSIGRYERYRNNYYYEKYHARYTNPDRPQSSVPKSSVGAQR